MADPNGFFKKRVLVPFWVIRIILMLIIIVVYGLTIAALHSYDGNLPGRRPALAFVILFMLMIIIVLLVDVLAIILYARDALKPKTFLSMNVFQTTFWTVILILDFVAISRGSNAIGIIFTLIVFLSFLGLLIYSIIGFRRSKTAGRGQYTPAHNPAVTTASTSYVQTAPQYQSHNTYQPPTAGAVEAPANPYMPPAETGAAANYYNQQPTRPANMV